MKKTQIKAIAKVINARFKDIDYRIEMFAFWLDFLSKKTLPSKDYQELLTKLDEMNKKRTDDKDLLKAKDLIEKVSKVKDPTADPINEVMDFFMNCAKMEE